MSIEPSKEHPTDDGLEWGYIDSEGIWRKLPKVPMLLALMGPPEFDVTLPDGRVRRIVHKPKSDENA